MWEDYHMFLITPRLQQDCYSMRFTTLSNYHLIIDDVTLAFVCLRDDLILAFLLKQFETGNRWVWTRIDYPPCITSKPSNLVYFTTRVPDTSDTNATRVRHKRHERHEWKTLVLITTQMKTYFHTPIFTIWQVKDYKERNNFILRTTFWKCLVPL